jgi:hypothetical protein
MHKIDYSDANKRENKYQLGVLEVTAKHEMRDA